ncbi:uncharacterized protein B0P05DRAFT_364821 [Gilbertella persicaria]|uniref:uncharacterized protein n=1 Tax=Gilbertella persicaria TaxID=101096 RepID=UPI00221F524A|nr:uncharacterized protein B0P05DRAFT_364821 [Gilbertella persicaria]KAI8047370.1 hypothetical protein B0P05DRAFT_364821 [Gilbertella persicaria]
MTIKPLSVNVLAADDRTDYSRSVYHSSSTAYGFCLNSSVRDTMAVCMKSEIQEIDLTKASDNIGAPLIRTRSISSSGLGQDHHLDSYPDTEEDDTDSEGESIQTGTTAVKQIRKNKLPSSRISDNTTPLISPAGSRTFDDHIQKVPQNLNLEHLHDSLRRSLTKNSEITRTPVATSPAPVDNMEREKMIVLRRPITASCAETHPQYPFCKSLRCALCLNCSFRYYRMRTDKQWSQCYSLAIWSRKRNSKLLRMPRQDNKVTGKKDIYRPTSIHLF